MLIIGLRMAHDVNDVYSRIFGKFEEVVMLKNGNSDNCLTALWVLLMI